MGYRSCINGDFLEVDMAGSSVWWCSPKGDPFSQRKKKREGEGEGEGGRGYVAL